MNRFGSYRKNTNKRLLIVCNKSANFAFRKIDTFNFVLNAMKLYCEG